MADQPTITLDWENLLQDIPEDAATTLDLIPPDTYVCVVDKAEAGLTKTGNPKIDLTLKVAEGDFKSRVVWGRVNFATNSPASMAITVSQLAEFGVTRQWLATNNPSTAQIASKLVGKPISVQVSHREYEGKQYYDVKRYKKAETPAGSTGSSTGSGVPF